MSRTVKLYQAIAEALQAHRNCTAANNNSSFYNAWETRWDARIDYIVKNCLPSGSGIDTGTTIDRAACTATKIVLDTSFHHMDQHGGYDGWTDHQIVVRPSFDGIDLTIKGRDRNQIKDYLHEIFDVALREEFASWPDDI